LLSPDKKKLSGEKILLFLTESFKAAIFKLDLFVIDITYAKI